jgi:hypothetical protein
MAADGHTQDTEPLTKPRRPHKTAPPLGSHVGSVCSACTRPSAPAMGVTGQHSTPSSSTCRHHTAYRCETVCQYRRAGAVSSEKPKTARAPGAQEKGGGIRRGDRYEAGGPSTPRWAS